MTMNINPIHVQLLPDGRMDSKNAALYLGLSDKTLAMMRCNGTGPKFAKIGRIFYFKADLDDWIAQSQRVTSTAQCKPKKSLLNGFFE